jgi:hypothetical protein
MMIWLRADAQFDIEACIRGLQEYTFAALPSGNSGHVAEGPFPEPHSIALRYNTGPGKDVSFVPTPEMIP